MFENAVAVVTGGASGIGRALAEELARRRAVVVIADIQHDAACQVAGAISDAGGRASAVYADVSRAEDVEGLVRDAVSRHSRIDLMFNNAGIGVNGGIHQLTLEHWRAAISTNLYGVVHGVAAAYPVMLRQRAGHIVNIASLAGLISAPGLAPYATTKGAVISLTRALRAEAAAYSVRASVVCPGFVDTAIFDSAIGVKVNKEELLQRLKLPLLPAHEAARAILAGVERNQAVIVFPASARVLWRLSRWAPRLLASFERRMVERLRSVPEERGGENATG
jgi:NAD(P)-dependent dehydrogenase (short-subunit alcohol dehydrogenase family)